MANKNTLPIFAEGTIEQMEIALASGYISQAGFVYLTDKDALCFIDSSLIPHIVLLSRIEEIETKLGNTKALTTVDKESGEEKEVDIVEYVQNTQQDVSDIKENIDNINQSITDTSSSYSEDEPEDDSMYWHQPY